MEGIAVRMPHTLLVEEKIYKMETFVSTRFFVV